MQDAAGPATGGVVANPADQGATDCLNQHITHQMNRIGGSYLTDPI